MKNGKWETLKNKKGLNNLSWNKIPYMGNGTKWKYFIVSSIILGSVNIFRVSTKDYKRMKYNVLKIKNLEFSKGDIQ